MGLTLNYHRLLSLIYKIDILKSSQSLIFVFSESILLFHDFPRPTLQFHDFPGLENEILEFHVFPPEQTLLLIQNFDALTKNTCSSESGEEFGNSLCNKDVVSTLAMDSLSASLPCIS